MSSPLASNGYDGLKAVIVLTTTNRPIAMGLLQRDDTRLWRVLANGVLFPSRMAAPMRGVDDDLVVNNPECLLPQETASHWGVDEAYRYEGASR